MLIEAKREKRCDESDTRMYPTNTIFSIGTHQLSAALHLSRTTTLQPPPVRSHHFLDRLGGLET